MPIEDWMKREVITIPVTAVVAEAAATMAAYRVGTLPVLDEQGRLVGMLSMHDVLAAFLPDFVALLEDLDFLGDLGDLHPAAPEPSRLQTPVGQVMHQPLTVEQGTGLMLTAALLQRQSMSDICVVDHQGRLVGIASRVDVGAALLSEWLASHPVSSAGPAA